MPGRIVRDIVGERIWDSYFKFTIERDPREQVQPPCFWRESEGQSKGSFPEFLESGTPLRDRNAQIYVDQGCELQVDFVIDHSRLVDDFAEVCRVLAIPFGGSLPRAKGGVPRDETIVITSQLRKAIELSFAMAVGCRQCRQMLPTSFVVRWAATRHLTSEMAEGRIICLN